MQFHVEDMTCGGCARSITKAVQAADPAADVVAHPDTRKLEIVSSLPREDLLAILDEAGFRAVAEA